MPDLSVVVVNYNTREATSACLRSVLEAAPSVDLELIVVDNGSVDGSVPAFRKCFPEVDTIEAGENLGFARGVNLGVRAATGTWVLLLNPDTITLPGSLQALLRFAADHPEYGVFGGRTLRPDGTVDPSSCWGAPSLWSLTMFATMLSTVFKRSPIFDPESLGAWQRDSVREVPIVTGCLLLISRSEWDRLGGMDEDYFLYGEDAEFSMRAGRAGLRRVVVPDAVIVHDVGGSSDAGGAKGCMVMAGKVTHLRKTWPPRRATLGIRLLIAGVGVRAALEALTRRARAPWSTVWRRRRDWADGYPAAEATLFGRELADA
ncbi:glycosyltransferase family 2 protein [Agromyces sp. ISL-38]|uniref:glycosyltransferase family 2 protein n=1 Tax=Agromyces sp. ISL-38 TaxID=2819107 RepID=UPI001BEA793B|nr:glycosyltransferase family 2 protein [Agromyces sp. ISL-38]MBT2498943.1 glycosyltransferase family 2 protein [Agromyces sp. ISL-38]